MLTDFEKVMGNLSAQKKEVFVFIDDLLKVTKGTKEEHLQKVLETLEVIDDTKKILKGERDNSHNSTSSRWDTNCSKREIRPIRKDKLSQKHRDQAFWKSRLIPGSWWSVLKKMYQI